MKQILSDHDRNRLDTLIADVEKRTNSQIVLALIQRSDIYAEIPWKAFAMGASATGLLVFILDLFLFYGWYPKYTVLIPMAGILAGGAVFALLTLLMPGFAKRFLSADRTDVEVRQYAESLFLSRELFATNKRTGILVLISLFERKIVILPDRGLRNQFTKEVMLLNPVWNRLLILWELIFRAQTKMNYQMKSSRRRVYENNIYILFTAADFSDGFHS